MAPLRAHGAGTTATVTTIAKNATECEKKGKRKIKRLRRNENKKNSLAG